MAAGLGKLGGTLVTLKWSSSSADISVGAPITTSETCRHCSTPSVRSWSVFGLFVRSFVRGLFVRSCVRSFARSFVRPSVRSFVRPQAEVHFAYLLSDVNDLHRVHDAVKQLHEPGAARRL